MTAILNNPAPRLTIVVTGRNDNYGGEFDNRFFRSVAHNGGLLAANGVNFEYLLAEWNPLPDRPLLSERFVSAFPWARAIVIGPAIHQAYGRNSAMPFFEMPAKNAALRRARGEFVLITNADILFDDTLVSRIAQGPLDAHTLYRAHRIDVPPALDWPTLKDPAHQLPSSEGRLPPAYYLGSAGDFMLASRSLWLSTTGLNEVIRWTTRAKDWQFCLGIAKRGIPIEFLGDVFHLDHAEGFRNTAVGQRDTAAAHFGGTWDFEFGLPSCNRPNWGLADCTEEPGGNRRVASLQCPPTLHSLAEEAEDNTWHEYLAAPPAAADDATPLLAHVLAAAPGRVIVRPSSPPAAVAATGLARVARHLGRNVDVDFSWPPSTTLSLSPERPVAPPASADLILTEHAGRWSATMDGRSMPACPRAEHRPPVSPRFNPLLARRLLRVWLQCRAAGLRRLALFGAGGHTREVLSWGLPDALAYVAVLTSDGPAGTFEQLPLCPLAEFDPSTADAVVLSSTSFETDMMKLLAGRPLPIPVLPLYADWPAGF